MKRLQEALALAKKNESSVSDEVQQAVVELLGKDAKLTDFIEALHDYCESIIESAGSVDLYMSDEMLEKFELAKKALVVCQAQLDRLGM